MRAKAGHDIAHNLTVEVGAQLKGTRCRAFAKDMRVRSGPLPARYSQRTLLYPDLLVVCGELQFLDENRDVIINPKVIIEVTSPLTGAFDRGEKFRRYRTFNPSLTDYLIVAQDRPFIEHFALGENGLWVIAASVVRYQPIFTLPRSIARCNLRKFTTGLNSLKRKRNRITNRNRQAMISNGLASD